MSCDERIESLRTKHHDLDSQLMQEIQRPLPDAAVITKLKREKLRLKDEIVRLSHD